MALMTYPGTARAHQSASAEGCRMLLIGTGLPMLYPGLDPLLDWFGSGTVSGLIQ
jgi:hypothetical protein